jgi:tRNA(fMet)-specific endonuclease VapC
LIYLLDTDTCIYLLQGKAPGITERLRNLRPEDVGTTTITAAELHYGAQHSARTTQNLARVETFLRFLPQIPFDTACARHYSELKHALASRATLIGPMDLLIAAIAVSNEAILVTNNTREFSRVPRLRSENWL